MANFFERVDAGEEIVTGPDIAEPTGPIQEPEPQPEPKVVMPDLPIEAQPATRLATSKELELGQPAVEEATPEEKRKTLVHAYKDFTGQMIEDEIKSLVPAWKEGVQTPDERMRMHVLLEQRAEKRGDVSFLEQEAQRSDPAYWGRGTLTSDVESMLQRFVVAQQAVGASQIRGLIGTIEDAYREFADESDPDTKQTLAFFKELRNPQNWESSFNRGYTSDEALMFFDSLQRQRVLEEYGKVGLVATTALNEAAQLYAEVMKIKAMTRAIPGRVGGATRTQAMLNRFGHAALIGSIRGAMYEGTASEKLNVAAITTAYMATPALSGWFSDGSRVAEWLLVKGSDFLLNQGISWSKGQLGLLEDEEGRTNLGKLLEQADAQAIADGNPEQANLYRAIEIGKVIGTDAFFALLTTSLRRQVPQGPEVRRPTEPTLRKEGLEVMREQKSDQELAEDHYRQANEEIAAPRRKHIQDKMTREQQHFATRKIQDHEAAHKPLTPSELAELQGTEPSYTHTLTGIEKPAIARMRDYTTHMGEILPKSVLATKIPPEERKPGSMDEAERLLAGVNAGLDRLNEVPFAPETFPYVVESMSRGTLVPVDKLSRKQLMQRLHGAYGRSEITIKEESEFNANKMQAAVHERTREAVKRIWAAQGKEVPEDFSLSNLTDQELRDAVSAAPRMKVYGVGPASVDVLKIFWESPDAVTALKTLNELRLSQGKSLIMPVEELAKPKPPPEPFKLSRQDITDLKINFLDKKVNGRMTTSEA